MGWDNASDLAERDENWDRIEQRRMENDGYISRPITRRLPPLRDVRVLHHMRDTGGGFVRALAEAWFRADPDNQARLHEAFGHYYREYRDSLYTTSPPAADTSTSATDACGPQSDPAAGDLLGDTSDD